MENILHEYNFITNFVIVWGGGGNFPLKGPEKKQKKLIAASHLLLA